MLTDPKQEIKKLYMKDKKRNSMHLESWKWKEKKVKRVGTVAHLPKKKNKNKKKQNKKVYFWLYLSLKCLRVRVDEIYLITKNNLILSVF